MRDLIGRTLGHYRIVEKIGGGLTGALRLTVLGQAADRLSTEKVPGTPLRLC